MLITVVLLAAVLGFFAFVPMPYRTRAQGVIWVPEESFVRARADGFIVKILATPGSRVEKGTPLFQLSNELLGTQEKIYKGRVVELEATYQQYLPTNLVRAKVTQDELMAVKSRVAKIRSELDDLIVRSDAAGTFIVPIPEDMPDRFVHKGELMAYVLENKRTIVRAVVSQPIIDLVRSRTEAIDVRVSERLAQPVPAKVIRAVPGASEQLPAPALGTAGGGQIATDPRDQHGLKAARKVFQLDLEIPSESQLVNLGGRCYIRFNHGWAPLGYQFYFQLRQLFLSRFNV